MESLASTYLTTTESPVPPTTDRSRNMYQWWQRNPEVNPKLVLICSVRRTFHLNEEGVGCLVRSFSWEWEEGRT